MRSATIRKKSRRASQKKVPETDAIFEQIATVNQAADANATVLRLSLDGKATVKVGPFARGGKVVDEVGAEELARGVGALECLGGVPERRRSAPGPSGRELHSA